VPFGIPQYVQYILYGLTTVLLCVPFIFNDSKVLIWWWHVLASFCYRSSDCLKWLLKELFEQLLIHIAGRKWQKTKHYGYFLFRQKLGRMTPFNAVCMGFSKISKQTSIFENCNELLYNSLIMCRICLAYD